MPCARTYTVDEITTILHESEGRQIPGKPDAGHTIARHVGIRAEGLSDRLLRTGPAVQGRSEDSRSANATLFTRPGRAIIMGEHGESLTQEDYIESWQNFDKNDSSQTFWVAQFGKGKTAMPPGIKNLNAHFDSYINRGAVPDSGSFLDIRQAAQACTDAINSAEWQTRLARLDAPNTKVTSLAHKVDVPATSNLRMYLATQEASRPVLAPVVKVFMLVMLLSPGEIHIQTAFPIG